jgi:hypothetical protein
MDGCSSAKKQIIIPIQPIFRGYPTSKIADCYCKILSLSSPARRDTSIKFFQKHKHLLISKGPLLEEVLWLPVTPLENKAKGQQTSLLALLLVSALPLPRLPLP